MVSEAVRGEARPPKSKRSKEKLRRVQVAIADKIGAPLEVVFTAEELALSAPVILARAS